MAFMSRHRLPILLLLGVCSLVVFLREIPVIFDCLGETTTFPKDVWTATNYNDKVIPQKKMIVLVQGEASVFSQWASRLAAIPYGPTVDNLGGTASGKQVSGIELIFASFDRPVDESDGTWWCSGGGGHGGGGNRVVNPLFTCQTLFIPNSTWTQGRNALVRAAWCTQERQQYNFSYWIFADDDIEMYCLVSPNTDQRRSGTPCWQQFFRWLEFEALQADIPLVGMTQREPRRIQVRRTTVAVNNFDAALNAFNAKYIHYFLPYAYMPPSTSWWQSQAVLFMVAQTCIPHMSVAPGNFIFVNPAHRDYDRGLNLSDTTALTLNNYAPYVDQMQVPQYLKELNHFSNPKVLSNTTSIAAHLRAQWAEQRRTGMVDKCEQLTRRFQNFLDRSTMKSKVTTTNMCDILPFMDSYP